MRPVSAVWKAGLCGRTSDSPLHITRHLVSCPGEHLQGSFFVGRERETRGKTQRYTLKTKTSPQKKVLSLVLCVAMMLSVMVMSTGAAFTDQDEIQNAEAVDMTSALGIIDGYEDGSFQPAENIERGEAAKMISAMLNGGRDSVQETTESSYNDVLGSVDAWANKYIEYCTARGIVSGVGGDRFAPASNVTGTQLAKMLLVSLGYDSVKEGYQDNAMWSVNVNTDAVAAGLYAGIETIDMSAPLSRDNAAQMIWNALQAETVRYSLAGQAVKTGDTLLQDAFGSEYGVDTGVMAQVYYNNGSKAEYTYSIVDVNVDRTDIFNVIGGDLPMNAETYNSTTDYSDLFAMNVSVLYKGDEALCIRVNEGSVVVEDVWGNMDGLYDNNNSFTVNGVTYRLDNVVGDKGVLNLFDVVIPFNGFDDYYKLIQFWRDGIINPDQMDQYSFRGIDLDGDNAVDLIVFYPYTVLKTDLVKTDTFRVNQLQESDAYLTATRTGAQDAELFGALYKDANQVVERAEVVVNGTIATDGYVMAVPATFTATGMDTYTVLTPQSATVTNAADKDSMITLGSTEYNGSMLEPLDTFKQISVGKDYSYIEVNGYLFIMDGTGIVPAASNYVVATEVAANTASTNVYGTYETTLLFTDGTTKTVNAKVLDDTHNFYNNPAEKAYVGSMYTYTNDSAGNYLLTRVAPGNAEDTTSVFDYQDVYTSAAGAPKYGATLDTNAANQGAAGFGISSNDTPFLTSNGTNGTTPTTANQEWTIADDAVIFAFVERSAAVTTNVDVRADEYCVISGADLKDLTAADVDWAFIGANTTSQNAPIVEMAYVRLTAHPLDTTMYAYVDSATNRTLGDGHYVFVNVLTDATGNVSELKTPSYLDQQEAMLQSIYNGLENDADSIVQVILNKDGNLVGFNGLARGVINNGTVTVYDKGENISIDGTQYTINSDTVVINAGDASESLQVGETVSYAVNADGKTLDLIVYNN